MLKPVGCLFATLVALLLGLTGCEKPAAPAKEKAEPVAATADALASPDSVARVHWIGRKRLGAEIDAHYFLSILNLPETDKLLAQTLDKLALVPLRLKDRNWTTNAPATNVASAQIRALLDDVLQVEGYFEYRRPTNGAAAFALALRLPVDRAGAWNTNLASALQSLTGANPVPAPSGHGWTLKKPGAPNLVQFVPAGDWSVIALSDNTNILAAQLIAALEQNRPLFAGASSTNWLQANLDLARISVPFLDEIGSSCGLPTISLAVSGDGENVLSRGDLDFPKPLPFEVESWNLPTNLIHEPLVSMMAVQGIKPILSGLGAWNDLTGAVPPNQYFAWCQQGNPFFLMLAAPMAQATNAMARLGEVLPPKVNPWMESRRAIGRLEVTNNALVVGKVPAINPALKAVATPGITFLYGELASAEITNTPAPRGVMSALQGNTNMVFYQSEVTGARVEGFMYVTQLGRLLFRRLQLPPEAPSIAWLKAVGPMLAHSTTRITKSGSSELSFYRKSSCGFTALELHLLSDWLESPAFPARFHTLAVAPAVPPPAVRPSNP